MTMKDASASAAATLARGLGGASLGLGLAEVLAPGKVAVLAGVADTDRSRWVIRALGIRECGHAAALLLGSPKLVWTRVAGDVVDVAVFGAGVLSRGRGARARSAVAAVALTGIAGPTSTPRCAPPATEATGMATARSIGRCGPR
ncbi:cyclase/dehydrase domain protein [Mycobacterium kansasii 824]|nr:cyclase/dehydrase domain protein [Mycobacterium kansasii 824]